MHPIVLLLFAILFEIVATASLKASEGFTRLWPSVVVVIGYAATFYLLAQSIKHLPLGIAYAIWSGLGTVGAVVIGMLVWQEVLTLTRIMGIVLILIGVAILNLSVAPEASAG